MKFISLFLIFILSLSALADCQMPDGQTIKDGQMISLVSNDGPLSNFKTQDQDDLGICYSNAASLMLKSALPGSPDISYIHLAIQSKTLKDIPQYYNTGNSSYPVFIEAGSICESIDAVKKIGGACRKEQSLLESDKFSPAVQGSTFKSLGTYFDALNKARTNPEELSKWKANVALALDAINEERLQIRIECESQKHADLPLDQALAKYLNRQYLNLVDGSTCSDKRLSQFKKLASSDSIFQKDRANIKPSKETLDKFSKMILADVALKNSMLKYDSKKNQMEGIKTLRNLGQKITDFYDSSVPPKASIPACKGHQDTVFYSEVDIGENFMRTMKDSKSRVCAVDNKAVLDSVVANNQCIDPTTLNIVLAPVLSLMELGLDIDKKIQGHLSNSNPTSAGQLKNILMPGCYRQENLVPAQNLDCSTYTPCSIYKFNDSNPVYSGPENGCVEMNTALADTRKIVYRSLGNKRALGISVCTSFMKTSFNKTSFCREKAPGIAKHGIHAMTLAGLRCIQGKVEYQILNSWGKAYCPETASLPNAAIKCEPNTGRFWVSEEVMVDSMRGLSEIKNGAQ